MPAISPPMVIAPSERPATRKPTAAPGRIAWAIASPVRLMRRSIRNTPTGVAPTEIAMQPISARRMKPKSGEGLDDEFPHHAALRPHTCGGPAQASHICRARNWFSAVSTFAVGPWATSSRASIRVRGK